MFKEKVLLITGGTGSFGNAVLQRMLATELREIRIFSRDEKKQEDMRIKLKSSRVKFYIGDVRDFSAVSDAMQGVDYVFHAAALKQVPSCEYFPIEAVETNIYGAANIVRAVRENNLHVEKVIGISTDKACKPINVMGMTKALQERVLIEANRDCESTIFNCVRYGNVIASRGSIIPLFVEQIKNDQPITVTLAEMTRFLLSLDRAVDTVFEAVRSDRRGLTFVPKVASAKITDVATALMGDKRLPFVYGGIRPGEKVHEIMVSEEECFRTIDGGDYYVILPVLPELRDGSDFSPALESEYSSKDNNLAIEPLRELLRRSDDEIKQFLSPN